MKHKPGHTKAYEQLMKEGDKWSIILYSALALTLKRNWNKRKVAFTRLVDVTWEIWRECAKDSDSSMIKMCEDLTGIEIQNGAGVSWRDVAYLNGNDPGPMTNAQWIYMRQQQIKWIKPQIMACIMIGLHRKYHFGFTRCSRVYAQIMEIEQEFRDDPKRMNQAAIDEVGVNIKEMIGKTRK